MAILTSKGVKAPHQLRGVRKVRISRDRRGSGDVSSIENRVDTLEDDVDSIEDDIDEITAKIPSDASSSNKMATANNIAGISDDIAGITEKIPSNASASNKLVAKSDIVTRYNCSVQGTADAIADTKALVNHIITLGEGTYAGEFKRQGVTFGSYRLTYLIDGIYSKSVSGLVTYSINANTDATYQVSYLEDIEHGTPPEWKIDKLTANIVQSGTQTIPAQTLENGAHAEIQIPLVLNDFYCGRIDFGNLPSQNMSLSYNDFSGTFQDTRGTENRTQYVLYPIGKANLATLHVYLTNYTGAAVTIGDIPVNYYLEHHSS